MTALAFAPPRVNLLDQMRADAPALTTLALFLLLSVIPTSAALWLDDRSHLGEPIWLKPLKFEIALFIYVVTLAFFARWIPDTTRAALSFRAFTAVVIACILAEMTWIGGAAALGTGSHFNISTPVWAALYPLMGIIAITLTSASLVWGILIWRNGATGLTPALHLSVALGLVLTFVLTVIAASVLAQGTGHFVGTPQPGDPRVPVMGWSRTVGDLRVAHFFATHAMHGLPLIGLLVAYLLPAGPGRTIVWLSGATYALLTFGLMAQALAGRPVF
ncbi:hypothetical protein L0V05_19180 [Tabrizicola sp. J26]|uniref:hypothetical protein n=1 Tax=Alitabrizicola rongguiensis TaxID=2909234 RepID=UPI001F1785C3|nr:hypothetical protein [Tabrizicola rongguiensis]MCF1710937.1 hypothetical protein [Tabrizicola rongguiensis]